ncbi:hypothetical protein HBI25_033130 [Parastagonospora nodorum]|nr:hypothetical protein HBH52_063320 [Parastagonospora nodorum]KAH4003574.1 hypothetical protein HBI10_061270 [Parastagonospora nodorum]KAH4028842.1 hypothetical protein HBI13_041120 [Parastagonospora nodorum]KAH4054040.1 hypothetical protein HBH49_075080 [Parastagonospora nodorum]KAH4210562.1 hypothetical protein HBI95_061240 [Parastagonospora nodorum]
MHQMRQEEATARKSSSTSAVPSMESRILGLPHVVVQDILAHVVRSYTIDHDLPVFQLLQLRGVSKFFDNETTKVLGHNLDL